ncbi:SOS response-associated peptidase family protein [Tunturiibacter gelidoferens]|uniref:SOS response-associated peptidase family protein n=1 Tax=Tunturiibacter gelidiferens TaxID=3069689 RepID=UPI003873B1B3
MKFRGDGGPLSFARIPFFSKDDKTGFKSTSARAETIATVPTLRETFKRRHCIVPADWFYEWQAPRRLRAMAGPSRPCQARRVARAIVNESV